MLGEASGKIDRLKELTGRRSETSYLRSYKNSKCCVNQVNPTVGHGKNGKNTKKNANVAIKG